MIIEVICSALIGLAVMIIKFIPTIMTPIVGIPQASKILSYALWFFPIEIWLIAIANVSFWIVTGFSWTMIEWLYKKIPGVN